MKLFVITQTISISPAGKVFEAYITGLSEYFSQIEILCAEKHSQIISKGIIHQVPMGALFPLKLAKLATIIFGIALRNYSWELRAEKKGHRIIKELKPDLILTLASGGCESAINIGYKLSRRFGIKHAVHMCDPIPSPKGWETYEIYRKSMIRPIKKALRHCSFFSMNTYEMIKLEQRSVKFDLMKKSFVSPDPIRSNRVFLGHPNCKNIFTFLGSFYSARKPDNLIRGFSKLLQSGIDAELHLIGNNDIDLTLYILPGYVTRKILIKKWTKNVEEVLKISTILVDVDADIDDDPFISSKLLTYLSTDRIILSITRKGSPTSKLLSGIKESALTADFDIEEISFAMKKSLAIKYEKKLFDDRNKILNAFSVKEVTKNMALKYGCENSILTSK